VLKREEKALEAILKARVEERSRIAPSIPQSDVFAALRAHHAKRDPRSYSARSATLSSGARPRAPT
jgi:hypothetical protein